MATGIIRRIKTLHKRPTRNPAMHYSLTTNPNGTRKIGPILKSQVPWYPERQHNVIAIDFGSSTLAVAYKLASRDGDVSYMNTHTPYVSSGYEVHTMHIQPGYQYDYIPTVLLINMNAEPASRVEIGNYASQLYCGLDVDVESCIFFDQVKLKLQNDEDVNIQTVVQGSDGKPYYIVKVIALILRKIREKIVTYFRLRHQTLSLDNFDWVLTVPALWGQNARDMMREASFMAGLCSSNSKWDELLSLPLKPASTDHPITSIKEFESRPERLSLVYEPDAAAAWCKQLTCNNVRPDVPAATFDLGINDADLTTNNFFLTIDVGGGTIDVTAHQVLDQGRMKRFDISRHGEVCGGVLVNETFKTFLEDLTGDEGLSKYLSGPNKATNTAELFELLYSEFEKVKIMYAENPNDQPSYKVQLPAIFVRTYEESLKQYATDSADITGKDFVYNVQVAHRPKLEISQSKMHSFFAKSIAKLHECVHKVIDSVVEEHGGDNFEIFYIVGGFGGCTLIAEEIQKEFNRGDGRPLKIIVPEKHELAVVMGACVYHDHKILSSSDATYGIGLSVPFDPQNEIHVEASQSPASIITNDKGVKNCINLFKPIVHKGFELANDKVFLDTLIPFSETNQFVTIQIYRTEADDVNFTTDDRLKEVAEMKVDVSEGIQLPRERRTVEILFDFTGIDIKIFARFKDTDKRINASIDFLYMLQKFDNITLASED